MSFPKICPVCLCDFHNAYAFPLVGILILLSCSPNLNQKLCGAWTMEKVYEYDQDVTTKHNPQGNRWIEFNKDGSFVSDGDPFGPNAGRWRIDQARSILYIDSEVDDDDSEWNVVLKYDQMTWTGIGHPRKENTRLVHRRKAD